MFIAVHHSTKVPEAQGDEYLSVISILTAAGTPLPPNAAWLAYGSHLTNPRPPKRAQALARLVVELGGGGVEALQRETARLGAYAELHREFIGELMAMAQVKAVA